MGVVVDTVKKADEKISNEIGSYSGLYTAAAKDVEAYVPCIRDNMYGSQVLHTDGYMTEDMKANLVIPEGNRMFKERKVYDTIQLRFEEYLTEKGLKA
jgi:formate dehydrogenase major subunit